MVVSCSAYGCTNKWRRDSSVHFHKFPFRSEKLCRKWMSALKRKNFTPTRASLVCSDHFTKDDYVLKPGLMKRRLKSSAVPTIFNFPVGDYSPREYMKQLSTLSPARKKRGRKKLAKKKKKLERPIVEPPVVRLDESDYEFDGAPIEEMEIFENNQSDCASNDDLINEESEEDASNDVDENKCYSLGNTWSERLKLLSPNVRVVARQMIDRIFELAQTGTLNEEFVIVKDS